MGKKKKIKKSMESFEKQKKKHEEKIRAYIESGGKNPKLIDYWKGEIEIFESKKKEQEEKLARKKSK